MQEALRRTFKICVAIFSFCPNLVAHSYHAVSLPVDIDRDRQQISVEKVGEDNHVDRELPQSLEGSHRGRGTGLRARVGTDEWLAFAAAKILRAGRFRLATYSCC
jgi:hypothetical protein